MKGEQNMHRTLGKVDKFEVCNIYVWRVYLGQLESNNMRIVGRWE